MRKRIKVATDGITTPLITEDHALILANKILNVQNESKHRSKNEVTYILRNEVYKILNIEAEVGNPDPIVSAYLGLKMEGIQHDARSIDDKVLITRAERVIDKYTYDRKKETAKVLNSKPPYREVLPGYDSPNGNYQAVQNFMNTTNIITRQDVLNTRQNGLLITGLITSIKGNSITVILGKDGNGNPIYGGLQYKGSTIEDYYTINDLKNSSQLEGLVIPLTIYQVTQHIYKPGAQRIVCRSEGFQGKYDIL